MNYANVWSGRGAGAAAVAASLAVGACLSRPPKTEAEPPGESGAVEKGQPEEGRVSQYQSVASTDVLGGKGLRAFELRGAAAESAELRVVPVEGQPFGEVLRAEVKQRSANPWDIQLGATPMVAVAEGDVVLISLYFRTAATSSAVGVAETGEGRAELTFERSQRPWQKSVTYQVRGGSEWRRLFVPFRAKRDFAAGEAQIAFRLGFFEQTIELADVRVENFQQRLALADLPETKMTYPGQEADAAWRGPAEARIEKLRKADLTVEVVDQAGKPVAGAEVHAVLSRHEFGFGTCAPASQLLDRQQEKYNGYVTELFNLVTLENDLKWQPLAGDWEPEYTLGRARSAVDWALGEGLRVRGHVLVWPGWRNLPARLQALEAEPEKLRAETLKHVRELVGAMKGRLDHWDVVNEPYTNHDLLDVLGHEEMIEWFKLAREIDPKPKLFINDFAILNGGGGTTDHRDHYEKMIKLLVDGGAPVDGVGLQGHFGSGLTSPVDLMALLDRYGRYVGELAVTEYDIDIGDEELAAQYTRDFYTVLFSHPKVSSIVMWGFWDQKHWKRNAVMYRDDWSLKPGGQVYRDLVFGKWHTDDEGATDAKGRFSTRGFKGLYDIEVKSGGRSQSVHAALAGEGSTVQVKL